MAMYAEKLMEYALSQVGTEEKPANSNKVKYNTWFYGKEVSGASYPWCCAFLCYCFNHVGFQSLFYGGKKCASCCTVEDYMIKRKQKVSKDDGRYGDIVFFNFGSGRTRHIGLIVKKNKDGSYQTVEGNTSVTSDDNGGKVMIRTRYKYQISSICRPKYTAHKLVKVKGTCRKFAHKDVLSKSLKKLTSESSVRWIKDCKDGWSQVISTADGTIGYVKNKYLDMAGLSTYKTATIKTKGHLRAKNSKTAKVLKKNVKVGTKVKVITKRKYWTQVSISGTTGYFSTKKIKF